MRSFACIGATLALASACGGSPVQPDLPDAAATEPDGGGCGALSGEPGGAVDRAFGGDGVTWAPGAQDARSQRVFALPDGGILLVATHTWVTEVPADGAEYVLMRFFPNGTLDASFGQAGVRRLPSSLNSVANWAAGVAPDGRILLVRYDGDRGVVGLTRLRADGAIDLGWIDLPPAWNYVSGAGSYVVTADAAGMLIGSIALDDEGGFYLHRLALDGSFDAAFGEGGWLLDHVGGWWATTLTQASIDREGRIWLVANVARADPAQLAAAVIRYTPNGARDGGYGVDGAAESNDLWIGNLVAARLDCTGRMIVAGEGAIRFTADGRRDLAFGAGGLLMPPEGLSLQAFALGLDGSLLFAGTAARDGAPYLAVARFSGDGAPDAAFGAGGVAVGNYGSSSALAVDETGGILVAGATRPNRWDATTGEVQRFLP